jgi:hypothetical protein
MALSCLLIPPNCPLRGAAAPRGEPSQRVR